MHASVARWKMLNAPHIVLDGEMRAPSVTFEYMLYQALLGAWQPENGSLAERLQTFALKAAREGKQETSWLNPHQAYEAGVKRFLERILDRSRSAEFLNSLETLARRSSKSWSCRRRAARRNDFGRRRRFRPKRKSVPIPRKEKLYSAPVPAGVSLRPAQACHSHSLSYRELSPCPISGSGSAG